MTVLGIIGSGIAGRSLIYALAKEKKSFSKIFLFDSDSFAHTCSLRSTAVVALRGVSFGLSGLGDQLVSSYNVFSAHAKEDHPHGVYGARHYSVSTQGSEAFEKRFPDSEFQVTTPHFSFLKEHLVFAEEAFLIDPPLYLKWLLDKSSDLPIEWKNEFVKGIENTQEKISVKTQEGQEYLVDQLVMVGGSANRYWKNLTPSPKLASSKPVQGSYLEFIGVNYGEESFSVTVDGNNFIYHAVSKHLIIGSTTSASTHELAPALELQAIYQELQKSLDLKFPLFETAVLKIGMREKSSKREPYLVQEGNLIFMGGFYKNGYSLGLKMAQDLIQLL